MRLKSAYLLKPMALSLRNKYFTVAVLLFAVLLLAQCSGKGSTEDASTADSTAASCSKPLNPNGDSELALLMRNMMHSSENMKEMIRQGKLPDKFPEEFLKIHTAKPTDAGTKKASFDAFATNYINNLELLYKSPKEELTQNYNAVVNACVSCHMEHCPGPLKAINKLKI